MFLKIFKKKTNFLTDIDECALDEYMCVENAVCNNTEGSYTCECVNGTTSPNPKYIECTS